MTDETTPADTHAAEPTPDPVAVDSTVAPEPGLAAPPTADHPVPAPAEKPDEQTSAEAPAAEASGAEASSGQQPASQQPAGESPRRAGPGEEPAAEQPAVEQAPASRAAAVEQALPSSLPSSRPPARARCRAPAVEQAPGEKPAERLPSSRPPARSPLLSSLPPRHARPRPSRAPRSPARRRARLRCGLWRIPSPRACGGPSRPPAETFGRVDESGTVFVLTTEGEREVGSYPGASHEEALHYFARKYDELWASADLLHQRLVTTDLGSRDAQDGLTKLREHIAEAKVVGDLEALEAKVAEIEQAVKARKETEAAERSRAREAARVEREALVIEAEGIAAQPENKIQWKTSGARMRALLDEWKQHQRSGARLDRETESALWQRFSHARNSFDKARRVHFAQLESTQSEAKSAKEALVAEAEALSSSTDWGATAGAYKRLMDRWRKAGRASRADDDALWERFKAAQDAFFAAKDQVAAAEDEEFRGNLAVKEGLLTEAQASCR